jgi:cytochrome c biogenesis protein
MKRALAVLGSLRLTFPALLALIAGTLASYRFDAAPKWWLLAPLGVLALNLLAAIASHPRFRRQGPLLAFHLCLLAALALSFAGVLTRLDARVEVLTGQAFDPASVRVLERGPWLAPAVLETVRFRQERFAVDYAPGIVRRATRADLAVPDARGGWARVRVGDTQPLVQSGTRFYTTSNKGLAARLTWVGADGHTEIGAVHFPSWPLHDWKQVNAWTAPSGERLELELVPRLAVPAGREWTFDSARVPSGATLAVRHGARVTHLASGQSLALADARLRFDGVGTWMGYRISHDPTLPWLLATGLVGALALGWHFLTAMAPVAPARRLRDAPRPAPARHRSRGTRSLA